MKTIFTLIFTSCLAISAYAQEKYQDLLYRALNAQYIFEGVVVASNPYKTQDEKHYYTSNTIYITRIVKGDLNCGTIELVTDGGFLEADHRGSYSSHTLDLTKGTKGIFLCQTTNKEISAVDFVNESNLEKLEAQFEEQSLIKYWYDGQSLKAADTWYNFDSLAQVYDLTQYLPLVNIIDCNNNAILYDETNPTQGQLQPYNPDPMPSYSHEAHKAFMEQTYQRVATLSASGNRAAQSGTVSYSMSNPTITGQNPKYFEFDFNIASDNGVYLSVGLVRFQYPVSVFGSSIGANNKILVTRGSVVSDITEYPFILPDDISSNVFAIGVSSGLSPTNLTYIDNNFQTLYHVKIEIADCNANGAVSFIHQDTMLSISFYETSPSGTNLNSFANISANQSLSKPACKATIQSFNSPLNGGVKDILEIRGYQFGATRGTGTVFLTNADNGGISMLPCDNNDFISWTDTLIKLYVPSIDTGIYQVAGTGKFEVLTNSGSKDTSDTELQIFYSLQNYNDSAVNNAEKKLLHLYNVSANGGYKFYVDTIISHNPGALSCVRKALKDWVCETGVNFQIVGDTFGLPNVATFDGINLITFGPINALGKTSHHTGRCPSNDLYINREIDMVFNLSDAPTFYYDSTGTETIPPNMRDFYLMLLHEFGHAVKHNHVNDYNATMYYAVRPSNPPNGLAPADRKVELWMDISGVLGGIRSVGFASNPALINGCSLTPMQPLSTNVCSQFNKIYGASKASFPLSVFPNPFSDELNISVVSDTYGEITIKILSITGQVFDEILVTANAGYNDIKYQTSTLPGGLYTVLVSLNGQTAYKKLIRSNE